MKAVACVLALLAAVNADESDIWRKEYTTVEFLALDTKQVFEAWTTYFERDYMTVQEKAERYAIFMTNFEKITEYNSRDLSFKLRLNQFADLTSDEFRLKVHGHTGRCFQGKDRKVSAENAIPNPLIKATLPASVDWVTQGVVTPVKNQGDCGSCWAFSSTGSTECNYAIATGTLNSLSEQQLMDCTFSYGNLGCDGGEMDAAFKYIEANGGLCSESEYPYTGTDGVCKSKSCGTFYNPISGYTDVTVDSDTALGTAAAAGCVSVAIEADQYAFQYYSSGILTGTCGTTLDHGVLVVGYGTSGSQEYWLVKNSWGTDWGEAGYVQICRECGKNGNDGECGINMDPSYPIAK